MLVGRFWITVPALAIAGSLAKKKYAPPGAGTLATHTPLFVVMLIASVIIVGAADVLPRRWRWGFGRGAPDDDRVGFRVKDETP